MDYQQIEQDNISRVGIYERLKEKADSDISCVAIRSLDIEVYDRVTSTNTLLKERALSGAAEGCVVVACEQDGGRGRRGRSFYSPGGSGIYMSLLLRPNDLPAQQALSITTMAAVAVCESIEALTEHKASIKWVNDIFVDGKKVCGILTEAGFSASGNVDYAVLGIGLNVYTPIGGFPKELSTIAGSISNSVIPGLRNRLVSEILWRFIDCYSGRYSYIERYKQRSLAIGRRIKVISAVECRDAVALDIDDQCRLIVRYDDGEQDVLSSGEISIKL